MRGLLQLEARAASKSERAQAAYELAYLFVRIQLDPRLASSPTLAEYQTRLRGRLRRIKQDVERDLARDRRAQRPRHASPRAAAVEPSDSRSPAENGSSIARQPAAGAAGGRAGPPDWGPALVELIERTIAPEFWDTNGGPGAIRYYYPLHALVVRATSDVHYRVGTVLEDLRAAGR